MSVSCKKMKKVNLKFCLSEMNQRNERRDDSCRGAFPAYSFTIYISIYIITIMKAAPLPIPRWDKPAVNSSSGRGRGDRLRPAASSARQLFVCLPLSSTCPPPPLPPPHTCPPTALHDVSPMRMTLCVCACVVKGHKALTLRFGPSAIKTGCVDTRGNNPPSHPQIFFLHVTIAGCGSARRNVTDVVN